MHVHHSLKGDTWKRPESELGRADVGGVPQMSLLRLALAANRSTEIPVLRPNPASAIRTSGAP
jgi:hypothetical protein